MGKDRGGAITPAKIVVLGGAGMLGHKMFQILRTHFESVFCSVRNDLSRPPFDAIDLFHGRDVLRNIDVANFQPLEAILSALQPEFVINCAGVIKQREAAAEPIPTITINSLLPHRLARMAAAWGGRIIHFSTDCVFNGKRGSYTEEDHSDAEDLYGKTKYLGEVAAHNALTLRTSIIGRELTVHRSLLDWFLAQNHKAVRGYRRVIYSGVTTNYLSEMVATMIRQHPQLSGLYQVASQPIAKYDLLCQVRDAWGLDIRIDPDEVEVSDRSMASGRLRDAIGYQCPSWPGLIRQLVEDKTPYGKWLEKK